MKRLHTFLISLAVASLATTYASAETHKIKKGENLYSIAKANHTTVTELCKLNGLNKGDTLKIGKVLKVPGTQKAVATATYKVKSGDALYTIAKNHQTDVTTLKSLNGLKDNTLKAGQTLKVPALQSVKVATNTTPTPKSERKLAQTLASLPKSTYMKQEPSKKDVFNLGDIFFGEDANDDVVKVAKTKLGNRYVWGATGNKGTFDCSGFTKYCYKKNGVDIPRTSIMQSKYGKFIKRADLQKGDLIFFDTSRGRKGYVNHVGIYVGDNKFIHASSAKKKVVITSLDKTFYSQRYMGARRPE
ncbi:NlpC/P60 family protein [Sulfurovum sp. zt1-1]|uniref:NlpC/P60 family protein n=1 Tax=Sulfurovum zhangzhouensis TaxID=3019067 RepID=A0ABT7R0A5_9BACT|nr:C40 family peptidase [Sulfurovum zhangzhouensis]MDM5272524.1 NlpC/P60 family protein [Sulfurovum zhangzhouensis]